MQSYNKMCVYATRANVRKNVTLKRVLANIVAVEKEQVLHILTLWL
jgi:hypothetical protein